jgi:hypothetical protein
MQTGKQRSLTLRVNKKTAGVQVNGYPRDFDGRAAFAFDNVGYPALLTDAELASMPTSEYLARLAAWKAYVEREEEGLSIDETTMEGGEAYRENEEACPIGEN